MADEIGMLPPADQTDPPRVISEVVETGRIAVRKQNRLVVQKDRVRRDRIAVDPRLEYVSGGSYSWTATYLRTLPFWVDDLTRDFGDDLYERMLLDPQIISCVNTLKCSILEAGVKLSPAVGEDHPQRQRAAEIRDFCERNLNGLAKPFVSWTLWNLLDALALGNKVAEQVYEVRKSGEDAGKLCLKSIKVKPRRAQGFVVDVYTNVIGLLGLIPGQGAPVLVEGMIGNPGQVPNLLPRRKFCVLTWNPQNEDVRGSSILRPAYNPWWLKQQTWGEYLRYISQFAGPSIWGTTPPDAQPVPLTGPDGEFILDSAGNPSMLVPEQQLLAQLQTFRNGTAAAFPNGTVLNALQMQGEGAPFLAAIELYNGEIGKAVLGQKLATEEAQHGTRAQATVHQDTLGKLVAHGKACIEEMIARDILRNLVEYNFGPEAIALTPTVSLSETERHDFASDAAAVAALWKSGYGDPSQYAEVDQMLGLPARSEESIAAAVEANLNPPAALPAASNGKQAPPEGND